MPRKGRIDYPGALHHVMIRGIECRRIFVDDADRGKLLQRLGHYLIDSQTPCYAWALMSNHIHLLIETADIPLSNWTQRFLTSYASYFNKRHQRPGRLFQNRYKSILCDSDQYLLELIRYIHLNPIRAGMLKNLDALRTFPWTGHRAVMTGAQIPWFDTQFIRSLFSSTNANALPNYMDYMMDGLSNKNQPDLSGGGVIRGVGGKHSYQKIKKEYQQIKGDQRILGSDTFVQAILEKHQIVKVDELAHQLNSSNDCLEYIACQFKVNKKDILMKSQQPSAVKARAACAALLADQLRYSTDAIAGFLNINKNTVSRIKYKGRMYLDDRDTPNNL